MYFQAFNRSPHFHILILKSCVLLGESKYLPGFCFLYFYIYFSAFLAAPVGFFLLWCVSLNYVSVISWSDCCCSAYLEVCGYTISWAWLIPSVRTLLSVLSEYQVNIKLTDNEVTLLHGWEMLQWKHDGLGKNHDEHTLWF